MLQVCTRVTEELHSFLSQAELSNFFVYIISYETWEITYQSQLCVNKYVSQALYQMLQTTKMKNGKLLSLPRLTICILHHNPPSWIALAQSNTPTFYTYYFYTCASRGFCLTFCSTVSEKSRFTREAIDY